MGARRSFPHSKEITSGRGLEGYSDRQLAQLACQGTKEAWQVLYLRHKDFLWQFARFQLKLPQELSEAGRRELKGSAITAEQFMNEVYVRMWDRKRFCSYEGRAAFQWWYAAVAANIYSDLCRQERKGLPPGMLVPLEEGDDE